VRGGERKSGEGKRRPSQSGAHERDVDISRVVKVERAQTAATAASLERKQCKY
jgi:hypothetical protein